MFKPIDIWRSYLANTTSDVFKCDAEAAFEGAVHGSNSKDNGDLVVVLPKLMLKTNTKAQSLAPESISHVRHSEMLAAQHHTEAWLTLSTVVH